MRMRKTAKVFAVLALMLVCFVLGWRVMPRTWPVFKNKVVYRVMPDLQPTPEPTEVPYQPESSAALGEPIGPENSLVYYFYKPYCPYCRALEPLMSGLPQAIMLPDGTISAVKLIAVDKESEEGAKLIADYYEKYGIAEEEQFVPAVVIGDSYLMPGREIIDNLMDSLMVGAGLLTPLLDGGERLP